MSLSHACVRHHSPAQVAILLLFTAIQSWSTSKECPTKQSVNEKLPRHKHKNHSASTTESLSFFCAVLHLYRAQKRVEQKILNAPLKGSVKQQGFLLRGKG